LKRISHNPIQQWLKRYSRLEAIGSFGVGIVSLILGVIVVALTAYFTYFTLLLIFMRLMAGLDLLGFFVSFRLFGSPVLTVTTAIFVILLFVANARGARENYERIPRVTLRTSPFDPAILSAWAKLVSDLLLSGPRLIQAAVNYTRKGVRLSRLDYKTCADILYELALRGSRISFRELSERIPSINPVTAFPQFLDLE
jgi:hypothetical protein